MLNEEQGRAHRQVPGIVLCIVLTLYERIEHGLKDVISMLRADSTATEDLSDIIYRLSFPVARFIVNHPEPFSRRSYIYLVETVYASFNSQDV